ncbi:hypothetical protein [Oceanipulchritudo coccoides]|uniref:hypothetical protein n=1 Tax=Oceanipulchritudo coccoides TaxID=2706888 RepID=UPI001EE92959|nr:hypothetical protein [Oceanipulchritudo coccoides]
MSKTRLKMSRALHKQVASEPRTFKQNAIHGVNDLPHKGKILIFIDTSAPP